MSNDLYRIIRDLQTRVTQLELQGAQGWVWLAAPLTSTSFDGDSFSTVDKTIIDTSAVFAVPAGVRAVALNVAMRDSGSAANGTHVHFSQSDTSASDGIGISCAGLANDSILRAFAVVPCNADGDIYYRVVASGASTLDLWIWVWGYLR